ncbi:MAG: aldolase/citrate lyase family protein [Ilumatobacteraceae bacterium]
MRRTILDMQDHGPLALLSTRLRSGDPAFMAWCSLPEPGVAEVLARSGFDAVLLDMQHGQFDVASASAGILAVALAGTPTLVRIPVGDFATAARMLDLGAAAVVAPMINSVEDAIAFASFTKYPPDGSRSWGPARAMAISGVAGQDFLHSANGFQLAIAMVESRGALEDLDLILAVPGIDGVLVGPSDLSVALTGGSKLDPLGPEVAEAMGHIAGRCRHHGKIAAAFCADGTLAREAAKSGYQLCALGTDQALLTSAAHAELARARR